MCEFHLLVQFCCSPLCEPYKTKTISNGLLPAAPDKKKTKKRKKQWKQQHNSNTNDEEKNNGHKVNIYAIWNREKREKKPNDMTICLSISKGAQNLFLSFEKHIHKGDDDYDGKCWQCRYYFWGPVLFLVVDRSNIVGGVSSLRLNDKTLVAKAFCILNFTNLFVTFCFFEFGMMMCCGGCCCLCFIAKLAT